PKPPPRLTDSSNDGSTGSGRKGKGREGRGVSSVPAQEELVAGTRGIQIGELLVEQGVLTERQVHHILKIQKMSHRPFRDLAERLYGIDPQAVEDAWVEQYLRMAGVINLEEQEIDAECLRLLSRRQAWQFHLLPLNRGR